MVLYPQILENVETPLSRKNTILKVKNYFGDAAIMKY